MKRLAAIAAAAAALALPVMAGAISPGEEMVLSLSYLGLPTGEGRIVVGKPEGDILPVILQAKTTGVTQFLDVRENLVVYWDADARLTLGSDLKAIELGDYHQDRTRFDRENGQVTTTIQRKGTTKEKRASCPADGHDLTGAFLFLRTLPLTPGSRYELAVCGTSEPSTLFAEVDGRERVKTEAGTFDTVRVRIRTSLKGKFSQTRDTVMWLSDDDRHFLVRVTADFAVGSMVATLKSYRPGTTVARTDGDPAGAPQ
jgi:hypothetical protein